MSAPPTAEGETRRTPTPRNRRKDARPGEMLAAALACFVEKGFAGTRMDDIAARCGVAKGTVYLYYPSKQAIFEALVTQNLLPHLEGLRALAQPQQPTSAVLRLRGILALFGTFLADPHGVAIPKLVMAEAGNFPEMARFYRREVVGRAVGLLSGVLSDGVQAGEFRPLDAQMTARLFVAPLLMAAIWQTTFTPIETEPMPVGDLLTLHGELFLRAIAAEHEASP
jgi:AcrR family transcriptional regulator